MILAVHLCETDCVGRVRAIGGADWVIPREHTVEGDRGVVGGGSVAEVGHY